MGGDKVQQDQRLDLRGVRVLVVEDEYFIADDLRRALGAAGATVVGPCSNLRAAEEALAEGAFDCAVLDLNLHGESAEPIADRLTAEGHSFAIATGYGSGAIPDRFKAVPRIEKPFDPPAILQLVEQLRCAKASPSAA